MRSILVILFFLLSEVSRGNVNEGVDRLIERSGEISLSRIVEAKYWRGQVTYTYEVIRVVKGKVSKKGEIVGLPLGGGLNRLHDFDYHRESSFWKIGGGRMRPEVNGKIHPSFDVGSVFLIFHTPPYSRRSFELIRRYDGDFKLRDDWLKYVEKKTNDEKEREGR
jgi:hypothetical protein